MNEQLTPDTRQRMQVLQRYIGAMEHGDIEALATVLTEAEQDQALEHMILEVNEVYQQEDQMLAQPADIELVQRLLNAITETARSVAVARQEPEASSRLYTREEPEVSSPDASVTQQTLSSLPASAPACRAVSLPPAPSRSRAHADSAHSRAHPDLASSRSHPDFAGIDAHARKATVQVLPSPRATSPKWYRARRTWLVAAVVAVLIALILFPSSGVLANQLFSVFRVQQFQPIQVTPKDLQTLTSRPIPTLADLGSLQVQPESLETHDDLTETQAAQMIGFPLLLPRSLPHGIANTPDFGVLGGGHATFTFRSSQARAFFAKNKYGNVSIPANLDGATFDITTTAGVFISYGDQAETQFMIVEVPSPILSATGNASLQDLRDFVLSLPGLPSQLVAQLKQINLTSGVVPLPIPSGVNSRSVTVHGTTGLLLTSDITTTIAHIKRFPAGSAVVWQTQGIIYALGGTISDTNQLLASANSLE